MTAYTLQELERLAQMAGQGQRNAQEQSLTGINPAHDWRVDVRRDIYDAVIRAGRAVTRAEIAKLTGHQKTTWLNERIEDLVKAKYLTRTNGYWKNGVIMYYYQAAE